MLLLESLLPVIEMTCTAKQQTIPLTELSKPTGCQEKDDPIESDGYDEEARIYRQYLAHQEALRELEKRKTCALASNYGISFIR